MTTVWRQHCALKPWIHVYRSGGIHFTLLRIPLTATFSFLTLDSSSMQRQFSIWQNAVETFRGCQQDLNLAPARILAQRLALAWSLQSITKATTSRLTSDRLPSRKASLEVGILPKGAEEICTFHWQSSLLTYTNDLNIYVWQPHLEQTPSVCYNSVAIILPSEISATRPGVPSAQRLLVVVDPPSLMTRFLHSGDAFVRSIQTQHTWDTDHETLRVLAVFFKWILDDSSVLDDQLASRTTEMVKLLQDFWCGALTSRPRHTKAEACPPEARFNTSFIWRIAAVSLSRTCNMLKPLSTEQH